ncbi:Mariner Mos1 transposase [Eumeta japonica]|uniref:Mariner Mos1 transposase n=1 Tax=Eumeta variegata TaxID=151549 RepID=A0A4C2A6N7_EUMVA|nr:Mariner Mos1 transposase [Eumeta japonica]
MLQWKFYPPPYSPDIAPSDFHLFHSMAHGLTDQCFHSYEEAKKWIYSWIASKDMVFPRGIHILPERWEKADLGIGLQSADEHSDSESEPELKSTTYDEGELDSLRAQFMYRNYSPDTIKRAQKRSTNYGLMGFLLTSFKPFTPCLGKYVGLPAPDVVGSGIGDGGREPAPESLDLLVASDETDTANRKVPTPTETLTSANCGNVNKGDQKYRLAMIEKTLSDIRSMRSYTSASTIAPEVVKSQVKKNLEQRQKKMERSKVVAKGEASAVTRRRRDNRETVRESSGLWGWDE